MESGSDLEQAAQAPAKRNAAFGGIGDLGNNFQQGTLASAIAPKDADNVSLRNFETDVIQSPEFPRFLGFVAKCLPPCQGIQVAHKQFAQVLAINGSASLVFFRKVVNVDDGRRHEILGRPTQSQA